MKVTSILLWTQENKLSEKFYKKLGFEVIHSTDSESTVSLNGFDIMLVNIREDELFAYDSMASDKGKGMYIYIQTNNVDETHTTLVKAGLHPHTEPKNWEWGNREFIVKDPDGYKLCFWQRISKK